ncbi:hypothetical protein DVS28_a4035 [Euzebya pacifica]|uniref:Uncharacterized protein n=1 Tax=Euzebya pacifica TaxID=1608957 RepID=A0A346Y2K6_9ACTN|nr:hypothetical protein [Euzebya pacifica]AXV08703.1 hypothetical protein DVS28_a4035 [Euzebya pacifica]
MSVPLEHGWLDEAEPGSLFVSTGEDLRGPTGTIPGWTITEIDASFLDEAVGVRWVGVALAAPGRGVFGTLPAWPVSEGVMDEHGYLSFHEVGGSQSFTAVDPALKVEVVVVYEVPEESGRWIRDDMTITYEVDGQLHRTVFPARGLLCVEVPECDWTSEDDDTARRQD